MKKYMNPPTFLFAAIFGLTLYFFVSQNVSDFIYKEYGVEISDLKVRDRAVKDSVLSVTYNTGENAMVEVVPSRNLRLRSGSGIGIYAFVSNLVGLIIFMGLFWNIIEAIKFFGNRKDFKGNLDLIFYRIGILLVIMGVLTYIDQFVINWYLKESGFESYKVRSGNASYFFFAFMAFAFMYYYDKGKEIEKEQALTI
ncbi:MAG: hypothetical protein M9898_04810 [Chitinophagaceae bacterium]|nr:hypothetical protein [Chitinophagaceae bacterium]